MNDKTPISTPSTLADKDRQAREICADPHKYFKAFSRTARRFQHMNPSPRYRVMTLVGTATDFLPRQPLKLLANDRLLRVSNWSDVFALLVRELVTAKPNQIRALASAGMVPWIASANPDADIIEAFENGEATLKFTTLEEAFWCVQWLLVMCDVKLNEVVVQVDPFESDEAWRVREAELRAKRTEENRVLREIDQARQKYAEEHPDEPVLLPGNKRRIKPANEEELTWGI